MISLTLLAILHLSQGSRVHSAPSPLSEGTVLPALQAHPLPATLAAWQGDSQSGDYFDQIQPVAVGYLVWSHFPVLVYVEPLKPNEPLDSFVGRQAQVWREAILAAIQEWTSYLPLQTVERVDQADIVFLRTAPPLQLERSARPASELSNDIPAVPRRLPLARARSAETRFELYTQPANTRYNRPTLSHRMTIRLRPDQAVVYLKAAARHELGHALGIWGHSPFVVDVMYAAQVAEPGPISQRDMNTLKRLYQQPTRLGWPLP